RPRPGRPDRAAGARGASPPPRGRGVPGHATAGGARRGRPGRGLRRARRTADRPNRGAVMTDEVEPALSTGPLLAILVVAVAVLLFLIMKVRLHAFLALIVVSLLTALATGISLADVVPTLVEG